MTISLSCRGVKEHFGYRMQDMITSTMHDGIERGTFITMRGNKVMFGDTQQGHDDGIQLKRDSDLSLALRGEDVVGTFHTHPNVRYDEELSLVDLKMLMDSKIHTAMIGFAENGVGMVSIFEPPDGPNEKMEKIKSLDEIDVKTLKELNRRLRVCNIELWQLS